MNRDEAKSYRGGVDVPHTRGDEPALGSGKTLGSGMFPTPVGMNRFQTIQRCAPADVPHTRGDENIVEWLSLKKAFYI